MSRVARVPLRLVVRRWVARSVVSWACKVLRLVVLALGVRRLRRVRMVVLVVVMVPLVVWWVVLVRLTLACRVACRVARLVIARRVLVWSVGVARRVLATRRLSVVVAVLWVVVARLVEVVVVLSVACRVAPAPWVALSWAWWV